MAQLPAGPWQEVSMDFANLPTGEHLLAVMDDYSRYPDVEIVHSTSARAVISKLDRMFSAFGVPLKVRCDNGQPFNSEEFHKFADYLGFYHERITPRWPRANGEIEILMKTLNKVYRVAHCEGSNWQQELCRFLRNYRATPHPSTGIPPTTLLLGWSIRTRLPEILSGRSDPQKLD